MALCGHCGGFLAAKDVNIVLFFRPFFADRAYFRDQNYTQKSNFAPGGCSRYHMALWHVLAALGWPYFVVVDQIALTGEMCAFKI